MNSLPFYTCTRLAWKRYPLWVEHSHIVHYRMFPSPFPSQASMWVFLSPVKLITYVSDVCFLKHKLMLLLIIKFSCTCTLVSFELMAKQLKENKENMSDINRKESCWSAKNEGEQMSLSLQVCYKLIVAVTNCCTFSASWLSVLL